MASAHASCEGIVGESNQAGAVKATGGRVPRVIARLNHNVAFNHPSYLVMLKKIFMLRLHFMGRGVELHGFPARLHESRHNFPPKTSDWNVRPLT